MSRLSLLLALATASVVVTSCKKSPPANVAATVNDRAITFTDLEKQFKMQFPAEQGQAENDDQAMINKLEVLRSMIDQEIMMQRAEKNGLLAQQADVDEEEFKKRLAERKMTAEDLKADIRKKLSIEKLITKEITSKINITDKDVSDFYAANRQNFNLAEPQVHLAQILTTPQPDNNVRNLKNDKAQNDDQAKRKIQQIAERIRAGEDFSMLAQNYSEDPGSSANGGDLGFVSETALEKANVALRRMVSEMQPGQVSPVINTGEGYRILKLLSKEPAGQRELSDPRVQQTIRETLMNRKDQLFRSAFLEAVRNEAHVENYLARVVGQLDPKK
jgi:peptidyl-prolyl cis-trans isomerase SurA